MRTAMYRRRFLAHLLASPLYAGLAQELAAQDPATAGKAINLEDLARVAESNMMPQHWAYLMTGSDDDATIQANRDGFNKFRIRPNRFVDVGSLDMSVKLWGRTYPTPLMLSPCGSQQAFHPEGEIATARAAGATGHQMTLSTTSSTPVGEVAKAYENPLWFQLYPTSVWSVTEGLIRRAEDAGCPVLALTVDTPTHSNRETLAIASRASGIDCNTCHLSEFHQHLARKANFRGLDVSQVQTFHTFYDWKRIDRIRATTKMKLVPKGIETAEDAAECVEHGMDGIWISNHGGRQLNSLYSTIEALPEIAEAVAGRIPIFIDSGFRRGTDVFKALAMGATAVSIGRPYLWGLGAFGQAGVEKVFDLFRGELVYDMSLAGTPTIADITAKSVQRRA